MNTAIAARVAAGVTTEYLRDLTRHPAPAAGDAPNHRQERRHALSHGRRRARPGRDRARREVAAWR